MMENPKSLHWTSGSANSSRAAYLDKARPKEEANFCDLFIKSSFSQNHAFPGCYALLATSDAALVTMKNNNARMQEYFSWL